MNNWYGIILTSSFTIIGGVIIFCFSQLALKLFIEPIQELSKCRGEICDVLLFNRNLYLNAGTLSEEKILALSHEIRKLGTKLLSIKNILRCNKFFSKLNLSIKGENILKAHKALIGLSNAIGRNLSRDEIKIISRYENEIKEALNISFE